MSIEKVGENIEGATVSSLRHLCFSEEKKMRFSRGEMAFYILKIRSNTVNVAQVNEEKVKGGFKTFWVATKRAVQPGDISGPLSSRGENNMHETPTSYNVSQVNPTPHCGTRTTALTSH
ncbi:hypothetical protein E2C01_003591 [Portunus trituberculatus]|uniref:Uncharacterized protein n=1 Tax=Portunus trituberculatus TaxID=210409 RepID=A0A5B7CMU2_PORTR|nr:hypothetical protein [Portunus trituberculatus]